MNTQTKKQEEELKVKQERIVNCTKGVNKILDQYGCQLQVYFIISAKGNIPRIEVVSK